MADDRVVPIRLTPGEDDDLYKHLKPHKEKRQTGGQSGEAKRLMREGLRFREYKAAILAGHPEVTGNA